MRVFAMHHWTALTFHKLALIAQCKSQLLCLLLFTKLFRICWLMIEMCSYNHVPECNWAVKPHNMDCTCVLGKRVFSRIAIVGAPSLERHQLTKIRRAFKCLWNFGGVCQCSLLFWPDLETILLHSAVIRLRFDSTKCIWLPFPPFADVQFWFYCILFIVSHKAVDRFQQN